MSHFFDYHDVEILDAIQPPAGTRVALGEGWEQVREKGSSRGRAQPTRSRRSKSRVNSDMWSGCRGW